MSRIAIASSCKAALLGGASVLALLLGTARSEPGRALPAGAATRTHTATLTHTPTVTGTAAHTATLTATRTPHATPTATVIPTRFETEVPTPDGRYPALSAEIDKAIASIRLEPLPVEQEPAERISVFRWKLDWTPPQLEGLPGAQYRLPRGIPYQLMVDFEIHPEVRTPEYIVDYELVTPDDHLTFTGRLAKGIYHWRIRADYKSFLYRRFGPWSDWQTVEIQRPD